MRYRPSVCRHSCPSATSRRTSRHRRRCAPCRRKILTLESLIAETASGMRVYCFANSRFKTSGATTGKLIVAKSATLCIFSRPNKQPARSWNAMMGSKGLGAPCGTRTQNSKSLVTPASSEPAPFVREATPSASQTCASTQGNGNVPKPHVQHHLSLPPGPYRPVRRHVSHVPWAFPRTGC